MRAVELEELALAVDTRRQVGARVGLVGVHAGRLRRGTRRIGHIDISVSHLTTATIDTIMAVVAAVATVTAMAVATMAMTVVGTVGSIHTTGSVDTTWAVGVTARRKHRLVWHTATDREWDRLDRDLTLSRVGRGSLATGACSTSVVLLDLGLEAATVRRSADARKKRSDSLDDLMLHVECSMLQSSLHDIVAK